MFDYLPCDDDPRPSLVAGAVTPAPGVLTALVPFSTSIVVDVPRDLDALRARHGSKYWQTRRRQERRFVELFGPLAFEVLTEPAQIRRRLPEVQALFLERWSHEFTSLPWKHEAGFSAYAEALLQRAEEGRGALVVLDGDGRLLSFAYCLIEDHWCYWFQHATTTDPRYRAVGLGRLLLVRLLTHLVDQGDIDHLDLMLGDAAYKREWESWRRPVTRRIEEPVSAAGLVRLTARTAVSAARVHVQFNSPRLRHLAKRVLLQRQVRQVRAVHRGPEVQWRVAG